MITSCFFSIPNAYFKFKKTSFRRPRRRVLTIVLCIYFFLILFSYDDEHVFFLRSVVNSVGLSGIRIINGSAHEYMFVASKRSRARWYITRSGNPPGDSFESARARPSGQRKSLWSKPHVVKSRLRTVFDWRTRCLRLVPNASDRFDLGTVTWGRYVFPVHYFQPNQVGNFEILSSRATHRIWFTGFPPQACRFQNALNSLFENSNENDRSISNTRPRERRSLLLLLSFFCTRHGESIWVYTCLDGQQCFRTFVDRKSAVSYVKFWNFGKSFPCGCLRHKNRWRNHGEWRFGSYNLGSYNYAYW